MQQLADALGKLVELHIVTHRTPEELPVRHAQLHYLSAPMQLIRVRSELKDLLNALHPDVVHVNCCWHPVFAKVAVWAKAAGYRVVLSPHGMLEPWIVQRHYWLLKVPALLLWQRAALKCADVVHVTAESEKQNVLALNQHCVLLRSWHPATHVIANGIDVESISMRSQWTRHYRLLFMSRIHPKKGVDMLLRAFASLSVVGQPLADYRLQIAGEGEAHYVSELKSLAQQLGVADKVEWLGGIFGPQKWQLMREADLFILPTHSENFGIVVAESLASGTPVLTTKGTPWQQLETEHCGWYVDVNTAAIADGMAQFAQCDETQLKEMGLNGRRLVEQQFGTAEVASQFVSMYNNLLCN